MRKLLSTNNNSAKIIKFLMLLLFFLLLYSCFFIHISNKFNMTSEEFSSSESFIPESGVTVKQNLSNYINGKITSINLVFGTLSRNNEGSVTVEFYNNEDIVDSWIVKSSDIPDATYKQFELSTPIVLNNDSNYNIVISEEYSGDNGVAIYMTSENDSNYCIDNGEMIKGSVCYTLSYENDYMRIIFLICGIVIGLAVIIMTVLRVNENIIMMTVLVICMTVLSVLFPLDTIPDERHHFFRAYEVANVSLISGHLDNGGGGNYLPESVERYLDDGAVIDWNNTKQIGFQNTALYSPVNYIPQALGIKITQLFTNKVAYLYRAGRIANAVVNLLLCILALHVIPFGKRILFSIIIFPVAVQEMISLSPDGFTIAISILFFAYILRLTYAQDSVKKKDFIIILLLGLVLSLLKIVYVFLVLLVLIIPRERFASKKNEMLFKGGGIIASGILNAIWLSISAGYMIEFQQGVDSGAQVKWIITHIVEYYGVVVKTIIMYMDVWVGNMISSTMGTLCVDTWNMVWITFLIIIVYEICNCFTYKITIKKREIIVLMGVFLLTSALILTSLYVQWTSLENDFIRGGQGRYFIPIIGCLCFSLILLRNKKYNKEGILSDIIVRENDGYYYLLILFLYGMVFIDVANYYIKDLWI